MNFGKLKVSEFTITVICLTLFAIFILLCGTKLDIEKEKTKQLDIQQKIENCQTNNI